MQSGTSLVSASFCLLLATSAAGQSDGLGQLLVPIHTAPAEIDGTPYGLWAAGPDYKVRFDDGFEFYPVLDNAYPENMPLRWRTESVTVGGADLLADAPAASRHSTSWRYELRRGDVVEAYDVRPDGVEQTFVLQRRPAARGDLRITGRITTELRSADLPESAHRELLFACGQEPLVRYGEAWAVDAEGRRIPMETSTEGDRVHLHLAGHWLDRAAFPLVVDPLTSATRLSATIASSQTVRSISTAAQFASVGTRILVAYTRLSSAADEDAFAIVRNADFTPINPLVSGVVFTDVTTSWSTTDISAGYVVAEDEWILAFERNVNGGRIRVYGHDSQDLVTNSGWTAFPEPPSGSTDHDPVVGGSRGDKAYVAFREDGSSRIIQGMLVDPGVPSVHARTVLGTSGTVAGRPAITPLVSEFRPWLIAWEEEQVAGNDLIRGRGVSVVGTTIGSPFSLSSSGRGNTLSQPRIAGAGGRYLLTYVDAEVAFPFTRHLRARRLDWGLGPTPPTAVANKTITSSSVLANGSLAYDHQTQSHWAVAYRAVFAGTSILSQVARVGYTGSVTESQALHSPLVTPAALPAVTFARPGGVSTFGIAHATAEQFGRNSNPLYGLRLEYPPEAVSIPYGTSCASGVTLVLEQPPYAGSEFFIEDLNGLNPGAAAFYAVSAASTNRDLTGIGMPGCTLLVDLALGVAVPVTANALGTARIILPLIDAPLFQGDLFTQWLFVSPGANQLGLLAHHALEHRVR